MSKVKKFLDSRRQDELQNKKASKKDFVKAVKAKTEKSDYATADVGCGSGLSGKICSHNKKKLNKFVGTYKVKKSLDFQETKSSVDSKDQLLAEQTASPQLINYIRASLANDISKIPLAKGMLTLSKKEAGLYNGFFQDHDGQIVEKFDNQTIELVAKNLQVKELYEVPPLMQAMTAGAVDGQGAVASSPPPEDVDKTPSPNQIPSAHERIDMAQNRMDAMQRLIDERKGRPQSLTISFGNFSLELRKSVKDFVTDFKKSQDVDKDIVQKAINSWRKKASSYMSLPNDTAAAKELLSNWEQYEEEFSQVVYALQQVEEDDKD